MDCNKTIDFFAELKRLCNSRTRCTTDAANKEQCPMLGCCIEDATKLVKIIQKWSDEHPKKTYAQDFFEKFPKAQRKLDGIPFGCRKRIYDGTNPTLEDCDYCDYTGTCEECWNEPMEE